MPAYKLQGRYKIQGLDISIENAKGSIRKWYDPHGKEKGRTSMKADYGYIRGTEGTDGDHVDVYVGPKRDSDAVFIIDQMKKPAIDIDGPWEKFDEQKVMLGFEDAASAKALYMKQYDDPRFFGGIKEMGMRAFKEKVMNRANHGKKVAALVRNNPELVDQYRSMAKQARMYAELNLSKVASGEERVEPKFSSADRAGRIADRIDDVGIGLLAAPYVADAVGHSLEKAKNPRLSAAGLALHKGFGIDSGFGKSHGREIAGLAMVAPGVTHTMAKGVDKMTAKKANGDMLQYFQDHPEKFEEKKKRDLAKKKRKAHFGNFWEQQDAKKAGALGQEELERLEKVAMHYFEDYEYKTEPEKVAILGMLGRMAGATVRGSKAVGGATTGLVGRASDALKGGFISGSRGVSQQVGQRAARIARTTAVPGAAAAGTAAAVGQRAAAPVLQAMKPVPAAAGKWNPLSAKNVVMGGAAAGIGLGAYGGYKGIQTTADMLQNHHEPMALPGAQGLGRAF